MAAQGCRNDQQGGRAGGDAGQGPEGAAQGAGVQLQAAAGPSGERGAEGGPGGADYDLGEEIP